MRHGRGKRAVVLRFRQLCGGCLGLLVGLTVLLPDSVRAEEAAAPRFRAEWRDSLAIAEEVDRLLEQQFQAAGLQPTGLVNDADFLRRVSLDLTGRIPTPEEQQRFVRDQTPDKRDRLVRQLLASPGHAENWAAYWRDVIFSRATNQIALNFQGFFQDWMQEQLRENRSWSQITRDLLTATGNARENGAVALMLAHDANQEELAGEAARIFLGIQIQCANCHDHPTDTWTRTQFHELAAFFPRVRNRPLLNGTPRSFEIVSQDVAFRDPRETFQNPERLLRLLDRNRDGKIDQEEANANPQFGRLFERLLAVGDQDGDKALSARELRELPEPPVNPRNQIEHFMSDLENPAAQGTAMRPVFFVNGRFAVSGLRDAERRHLLADFITDPQNEWFAKAYVNRIWTELLGSGFYQPVDDLGPLREPRHPEVVDLLARGFTESGYNISWLFRVITNTRAYQRELKTSDLPIDEAVAFSCATPIRLRSDQIFDSLMLLNGPQDGLGAFRNVGGRPEMMALAGGRFNPKRQFADLFGYDPSTPQEDLQGTIPQALFMMNSQQINDLVSARGNSPLARLLRQSNDDEYVLRELYRLTLSREPTPREIEICQEHYLSVRNRTEVLEDVFWCLVNSSEFLTRR